MSAISNLLCGALAKILARPSVANWLINRALRTPYSHLPSNEDPSYMRRYWLFNPYDRIDLPLARTELYLTRFDWLPWSFRIHHIVREDRDRHLHDHPWNARTFILSGWYTEERLVKLAAKYYDELDNPAYGPPGQDTTETFFRRAGDTATLRFGEYHAVKEVSEGGVWTLFVTSRYQGTWGFLVNGFKVPYREYFRRQAAQKSDTY